MSGKYALIIGNTEYIDPGLAQLTAPGKDAEDFARVLKDHEIGAFDSVRILLNQMSSTVNESIDEFFDQKKPDDLLVLYFSGHGVRDELGSLYLAVRMMRPYPPSNAEAVPMLTPVAAFVPSATAPLLQQSKMSTCRLERL